MPGVSRAEADERLRIRVAADDPVYHDHVGLIESLLRRDEVAVTPLDALLELELDRTHSAADLEHARTRDSAGGDLVDQPLRGGIEALAAVTPRVPPGGALAEEPLVAAGAAVAHAQGVYDPADEDPRCGG